MLLSAVQRWAAGTLPHDSVGVRHSHVKQLLAPDVNIVHIKRKSPLDRDKALTLLRSHPNLRAAAVIDTSRATDTAWNMLSCLDDRQTKEVLLQDILSLVEDLGGVLRNELLGVELQAVAQTNCPRFHADHVGVRMLCTYHGGGTWYVPNRHVKRRWGVLRQEVAVEQVDEQGAVQVAEGDVLYLKGHLFPNNYGCGAVHRSPLDVDTASPRLLLTIDDGIWFR